MLCCCFRSVWINILQLLFIILVSTSNVVSGLNALRNRIFIDGDIILGALFPVHHRSTIESQKCGEIWEQYGIQRIEAFLMVLEAINSDDNILPHIKLGCDIRDSCWYSPKALEESKDFIRNSLYGGFSEACSSASKNKPIVAVIGPGSSAVTEDVQNMLAQFEIPAIGYGATSISLSNDELYPYFLRVVPPDSQQAQALADLVEAFNWKYVSTVHSEGAYGSKGIQRFQLALRSKGLCTAVEAVIEANPTQETLDEIVKQLREDKATVVVCFCDGNHVALLIDALKRHRLEDRYTIIGSDGWNTRQDVVLNQEEAARGSFSVQLSSPTYEPFTKRYLSLKPQTNHINPWFKEFWQAKFNCTFDSSDKSYKMCSGQEDLSTNLGIDGKIGFVVDALYTAALGLHKMSETLCPNSKSLCDKMQHINGTLFYEYMLKVNFTTYSGKKLYFDEYGDPPGKYQVMNYQKFPNGSYGYVEIATWDQGYLVISDNIQFKNYSPTPPESLCSAECPVGHAKHIRSEISKCCWICERCPEHAIITSDEKCVECELGWWPNENLSACIKITVEHIYWTDIDAILPFCCSLFGIGLTIGTIYVLAKHNSTAIVKASTRELSYFILVGIMLAYISTIAFIVKPTITTCYITRILPGLSFSMIYGSVLTKTNRIARILARGKKKIITKKPRCMTTTSLVLITVIIVAIEAVIIIAVLIWQPAATEIIYTSRDKPRLECNVTIYGIMGPLGFDFLLIALCTFYAVNTRNVPANFNEAKFIGFAMYVTCVIWIAFVPLYFGSNSKVITITLCITLSATVALILLFWHKAYIIVWHPEKNHRGAFTTTTEVRCHVGQRSSNNYSGHKYSYGLMKRSSQADTDSHSCDNNSKFTDCEDKEYANTNGLIEGVGKADPLSYLTANGRRCVLRVCTKKRSIGVQAEYAIECPLRRAQSLKRRNNAYWDLAVDDSVSQLSRSSSSIFRKGSKKSKLEKSASPSQTFDRSLRRTHTVLDGNFSQPTGNSKDDLRRHVSYDPRLLSTKENEDNDYEQRIRAHTIPAATVSPKKLSSETGEAPTVKEPEEYKKPRTKSQLKRVDSVKVQHPAMVYSDQLSLPIICVNGIEYDCLDDPFSSNNSTISRPSLSRQNSSIASNSSTSIENPSCTSNQAKNHQPIYRVANGNTNKSSQFRQLSETPALYKQGEASTSTVDDHSPSMVLFHHHDNKALINDELNSIGDDSEDEILVSEEKDLLKFQKFLNNRGVSLDMSEIQSSDV